MSLLAQHALGVTQSYARVTRVAGPNPFIAYPVINDGGQPGERTGAMRLCSEFTVDLQKSLPDPETAPLTLGKFPDL